MILYNYNKFLEYMNGFMEKCVFTLMTENNHLKILKGWYGRAYTKNFIHLGNFNVFLNVFVTGGSDGKESVCNVGDPGSIPGSGRSPGEGNGYSLQYSCLENSMDRGVWWAKSMGLQRVRQDWATKQQHVNM